MRHERCRPCWRWLEMDECGRHCELCGLAVSPACIHAFQAPESTSVCSLTMVWLTCWPVSQRRAAALPQACFFRVSSSLMDKRSLSHRAGFRQVRSVRASKSQQISHCFGAFPSFILFWQIMAHGIVIQRIPRWLRMRQVAPVPFHVATCPGDDRDKCSLPDSSRRWPCNWLAFDFWDTKSRMSEREEKLWKD